MTVTLVFTVAAKVAMTLRVTVAVPSALVATVGTTVTFEGLTPDDNIASPSYAAEAASACRAAMTRASIAFAGKLVKSVSVKGTRTVSVKLMITTAPTPVATML